MVNVKRLHHAIDVLIVVVAVFAILALVNLATYDKPYSCFDPAAGRELAGGGKSPFGSFIAATNCEYDDYWGEYICDQGIYGYCSEGTMEHLIPSDEASAPPWSTLIHTQDA